MNDYDTFYDNIKSNNGVLTISIPFKLVEFAGLKTGDKLKVMISKQEVKE